MRVAVIADDLTGAADTGVQFAGAGYRTAVLFDPSAARGIVAGDLDAVVLDTDSRALPPREARERVLAAATNVRDARLVYKKLDSTLRGPVAAELEAALEATGRATAVVAPAFPGTGRTTEGGVQMVRGTPVHETELAEDPLTPVHEAHVPTLLRREGLEGIATIGPEYLQDSRTLRRAIERTRWAVADAKTDEDLDALVRAVDDPSEVLWAGSAGLALALARAYPCHGQETTSTAPVPAHRVLVVVGSINEVSREQLRHLEQDAQRVALVSLSFDSDTRRTDHVVSTTIGRTGALLGDGWHVALHTAAEERFEGESARALARALAEVVARIGDIPEESLFDALILTGGDTAVGVARALGATGIMLEGEVESGVPFGALLGPRPYRVVTKAGGFGGPATLVRALEFLMEPREEE